MEAAETWQDLTLYRLLARAAQRTPDQVALVTPRGSYTFREILADVHALAWELHNLGIGPQDRVATLFGTRRPWIILHYAVALLGATLVPLNTRWQAEELRSALTQVRATVLALMDRDGNQDILARAVEACPALKDACAGRVVSAVLPNLRLVIGYTVAHQPRFDLDLRQLIASPQKLDHAWLERQAAFVKPCDTALILFTSGSTCRPKAAQLTHRNVIGHAHYLSRFLDLQPSDRYINLLPFFHVAGYAQGLVLNQYVGSALYLVDQFKPEEILDVITRHRITAWAAMPVTVQRVLDLARDTHADLSSLRIQHGVSPELWDRVAQETRASIITRMYGLTESAGLVTMSRPAEKDRADWRNSVGLPLPGVTVRTVDPATNQALPNGQTGEVIFRGWNCFQGYYGDPQATAATIDDAGYCHTGDQGFVDADGCLHLLGRYKEMIKTGGENVSALELELWLKQHIPGIHVVCIVGVPDAAWGEAVTALVEPAQTVRLDPKAIKAECAEHLASFKIPRHIIFVRANEWRYIGSGKMDRAGLRDWATMKLRERSEGKERYGESGASQA